MDKAVYKHAILSHMDHVIRMNLCLVFVAFLTCPFLVHAATVPAGFAPGTLWLSRSTATAGDTITIYTVVYDGASAPIEGDVIFNIDDVSLGKQHFKLAAGASQIVSQPWSAKSGAHTFSAAIQNVTGVSGIASTKTNTAEITVLAPTPTALDQVQNSVANIVASSSPAVQNIAQKVFATTEDVRAKGASWLSDQLFDDQSIASSTTAHNGQVLGAETYKAPPSAPPAGASIFAQVKFWVVRVLLYIFQLKWIFYVMLMVVIYILFKVIQGFFVYRRPL